MSILRYKQKLLADGGVARGGDGGGGGGNPGPSTTTSYNTNIPEYAKPYVENMLTAAQAQIYNKDMTGFNPYVPYSENAQDYFAGPSPMQRQAYSSAANMNVPGQYGQATNAALLGSAQALGAGNNYAQQATNARSTRAYMSPYIQNALQPQLQEMERQYGITGNQQKAQSVGQGAFGGNREALMRSENERNKNTAMNQAIGQGYQNAFQNAQQAQQFGANLGLQGAQTGIQGAGQLANIGGQKLNAQQGIANLQNTFGSQQQAQQQQIINQAIQNYATAQQYPFMQMGVLNSMLRGLPMQSTTTASYQAQPSTAMQAAGLLGAAGSYFGKKEGGIIGMKEGGSVPGYRYGSIINEPQLESMAGRMDDNQLNTVKGLPGITPDERNTFDSALINNQYVRSNPEAGQMIAQAAPPPQEPMPTDRMTGIAQAGGDMFNTMGNGMAGGGIIAFAGEGPSLVKDLPDMSAEEYGKYISEVMSSDIPVDRKKRIAPMLGDALSQLTKKENPTQETKIEPTKTVFRGDAKTPSKELSRADYVKEQQDMLRMLGVNPDVVGEKGKAYQKRLEETQAGIGDKEAQLERFARTQGFLSLLDPSEGRSNLQQAARGFGKYVGNKAENAKTIEELKNTTIKAQAELEAGNRARAAGDIEAANKHFDKARELQNQLDVARGNNAATIQAAEIHASAAGQATKAEEAKIEAYLKDHPGATRSEAYAAVAQYARGESNEITRLKAAIELKQKQLYGPGTAEEKAKIQREIQTLTQQLLQSGAKPVAAAPYEKTPTYDKGSEVTYNGEKYRFKGGDQYDKKNWEKV